MSDLLGGRAVSKKESARTVRNTVFTLALLGMMAAGVQWNEQIARSRRPVVVNQAALAETVNARDDFPLELELSREVVRLGQTLVVSVETRPFADLEIVTTDPRGQSDREETFVATADETGSFVTRFKIDDFRDLGQFTVAVKATLAEMHSFEQKNFVVETWQLDKVEREEYLHPILP